MDQRDHQHTPEWVPLNAEHAEKALQSVESRLAELADGLAGKLPPLPEATESAKGKGKATGGRLVRDDHVQNMSKAQIESEIKELSGLKDDLALKVCSIGSAVTVLLLDLRLSRWRS